MQKGTKHKPESLKKTSEKMKAAWSKIPAKQRKEQMARVRAARLERDMALDAPGDNG